MTSSRGVCARRDCEMRAVAKADNTTRPARHQEVGRAVFSPPHGAMRTSRPTRKSVQTEQMLRDNSLSRDFSRLMAASFQGYGTLLNLKLLRASHGRIWTPPSRKPPLPLPARHEQEGWGEGRRIGAANWNPLSLLLRRGERESTSDRVVVSSCAQCRTRLIATNTSSDRRNRYPEPT